MSDKFQTSREILLASHVRLARSEANIAVLQDSLLRTRNAIRATEKLIIRSDELIDSIEQAYANRKRHQAPL